MIQITAFKEYMLLCYNQKKNKTEFLHHIHAHCQCVLLRVDLIIASYNENRLQSFLGTNLYNSRFSSHIINVAPAFNLFSMYLNKIWFSTILQQKRNSNQPCKRNQKQHIYKDRKGKQSLKRSDGANNQRQNNCNPTQILCRYSIL